MTRDLSRLFAARSIAVIGGGAWCASILGAARRIGYRGRIFPVHREGKEIAGIPALRSLDDWSGPIDAAFIGVNRAATIGIAAQLNALNAGGAICFASGFSEARAEDDVGHDFQARLVEAAGAMPILGPNCYGFVNALDRVAIWPDQHGMEPLERGVAILTQSSNIALNLTMQRRALPLAMVVTCGNSAQMSQAALARALLKDDRITAIGLHVEGFCDPAEWHALAQAAHARGVPLVALKVGRSDEARAGTVSHTASLAGSETGAQALLDRLGIARLDDLPSFLEALKLLHVAGPLPSRRIASISCSGGEASLMADMAQARGLTFPALSPPQRSALRAALGPMVALANPLDYHTYVWRDAPRMADAWAAMGTADAAVTISIVDYPHTDAVDWACATQAAIRARKATQRPFIVAATLPELMPGDVAAKLMAGGVVPMQGLAETLAAVRAAADLHPPAADAPLPPNRSSGTTTLNEAQAKTALGAVGLKVPRGRIVTTAEGAACHGLDGPLAVKAMGLAHKTEAGAVRLNVSCRDLARVMAELGVTEALAEEMVQDGVAELLLGITSDPAHGFVLTLGAGGILTEMMADTVSLLLPVSAPEIGAALDRLRIAPLLAGYRGEHAAKRDAIVAAALSLQDYVIAHAETVCEVEVNPLICTPEMAVAADALIRLSASPEGERP